MNNKIQISTNNIVFSKWTRRSYAVFASLNKIVKIAHLSVDICISSLSKIQSIIRLLNREINVDTDEDDQSVWGNLLSKHIITILLESGLIKFEESYKKTFIRKCKSKSIFYIM